MKPDSVIVYIGEKEVSSAMETVKGPCRSAEEEITRLVETHQLALLRLCFAYLHDRALAEDAVQETFVKAYRKLDQFQGMLTASCRGSIFGAACLLDVGLLERALRYLRAKPEDVLAVGESFGRDIAPAVRMGMETALITNGNGIENLQMSETMHPGYIVENLDGLVR